MHIYIDPNIIKWTYFTQMQKSMFHIQGHSKDFWYNMDYASKRLEMCFHLYTMGFITFQHSLKMLTNSVCLSVHPSVHALTFVNILQTSWNLYMLFVSDIEWTIMKMVSMRQRIRLQRHTKIVYLRMAKWIPNFL